MTTVTRAYANDWWPNTSPKVNANVNEVHTIMSSAGLTQTSDTGQIALSGLTFVNSANTNYGYEMWRFPDSLQATTPIFIKIEYMSSSSFATLPYYKFSVGSSTDGAGTLTTTNGPIVGPFGFNASANTQASTSYACYTDGYFGLILGKGGITGGVTTNNNLAGFVIDRRRNNSTGATEAGGYLVAYATSGGTSTNYRHCNGASTTAATGFPPFALPNPLATGSVESTNVNVMRPFSMTPGVHPSLGFMAYYNAEFTDLSSQTFTVFGASHTYLPVGRAFNYLAGSNPTTPADLCAMIRWE